MKKYLLIIIPIILVAINGCQKIGGHVVIPSTLTGSTGSTGSTGLTGSTGSTGSIATADTSKGYFPNATNTFWKYSDVSGATVDTAIDKVTGNTVTINGKQYYEIASTSGLLGSNIGYYSFLNHTYTQRGTSLIQGITVEILYLKDNLPVNSTWTAPFTDSGTFNGAPAQILGKITEKGISRTVANKVYNNVIHTTLQLQYNLGSGFSTYGTYDYYIAKGIGIIESDAVASTGAGTVTTTGLLIDYSIK